jgi:hypothetical protein
MTGFVLDGYDPQGFYCDMLRCAATAGLFGVILSRSAAIRHRFAAEARRPDQGMEAETISTMRSSDAA